MCKRGGERGKEEGREKTNMKGEKEGCEFNGPLALLCFTLISFFT